MTIKLDDMQDIIEFNNIKPISSLDPEKVTKGYREIVLGVADKDEQDLYLKIRDDKHTWNNHYLGRSRTFKRGQSEEHWNVVVPIVPRCYTTADRDPANADHPRRGWIYIIRECQTAEGQRVVELWRELLSDGQGNFRDVQLKYQRGNDRRPATGQPGFRIIVPYRINNTEQNLWIAFSEVQWSWARIQQLKKKSSLRDKRMHKLDLSDSLNNFENCAPAPEEDGDRSDDPTSSGIKDVSGPAILHRLDLAEDDQSQQLPESFKDPIPVVYLDDPIGIARNLAAHHQLCWEEMAEYLDELRKQPETCIQNNSYEPGRWFEAAALANRYFYSDISQVIPAGLNDEEKNSYQQTLAETEERFAEYRNKLDRVAIDEALGRYHRQEIREKIKQTRTALSDFLLHELESPASEVLPSPQEPSLIQALDDYFTCPELHPQTSHQTETNAQGQSQKKWPQHYYDGWAVVGHLLTAIARHEYRLDRDLEAQPEDGWAWRRSNPTFKLMLKLADPQGGYSLHKRLFPAQGTNELDCDQTSVPDDDPRFKIDRFANVAALLSRDDEVLRGITIFAHQFDDVLAMRDSNETDSIARARSAMLRLVNGVLGLELEWKDTTIGEIAKQASNNPVQTNHAYDLFQKAVSLSKATLDVAEEANKNSTADIPVKTAQGNPNRLVKLLSGIAEDRTTKCSLAGLTGMIQAVNFIHAVNAFVDNKNHDKDWELATKMIGSFFNLAEATNGAANMFVAPDPKSRGSQIKRVGRGYIKGSKVATNIFQKSNLIFNIVDMGFTAASLIENLQEGDDAAAADAMLLTGATIGVVVGVAKITGAASLALMFGLSVSLPVLGLVGFLVFLAGSLAKTFLFKEDDPIDIWLVNGPFARGDESHEHLYYRRDSETISTSRNGQSVPIGCTVHSYSGNKLYVDEDGILVAIDNARVRGILPRLFQQRSDGSVWITPQRSNGTVSQTTQIGQIGEPFIMPPCLNPTHDKETYSPRKGNTQNEKRRRAHHIQRKLSRIETWFKVPKECYLALADALYRPRVTIKTHRFNRSGQILCDIDLPYFIPDKSKLFIEVDDFSQKYIYTTPIERDDPGKHLLTQDEVSNLKIGPNRYRIERVVDNNSFRTLEVRVRLNLYGTDEILLPYEVKFDGSDVETDAPQDNAPSVKWICASERLSTVVAM
jgi:hypothetical protein